MFGMRFDGPMRSLRRNGRGLSEIVGTLMLVIIVVSAATLLAAFVASYQKQLQSEEAFSHDQSLESIKILGLVTVLDPTGTFFRYINFTLGSEYINPSSILSISINNVPLGHFWWEYLSNRTWEETKIGQTLTLPPQQEIYVSTNTSSLNDSYLNAPPLPSHYLKFDVYTGLQNDFSRVFLPPVPLAVVSEINPSGDNEITLLDGSTSFQPGGNASLVEWAWEVTGGDLPSSSTSLSSATMSQEPSGASTTNGALSPGTVLATGATATFTVPSDFEYAPYDVLLFAATNLSVTPSSGCSLSGSSILPVSTQNATLSGTSLTVTFSFITTLSSGCSTSSSLSLAVTGVVLGVSIEAMGEEYEISPALPNLGTAQSPYSVDLAVTNSDGLSDILVLSYTATA